MAYSLSLVSPAVLAVASAGAISICCGEIAAQTAAVVDPPLFEYMLGGRATGFPFGYAKRRVVRHQEIRDNLAGQPRLISNLRIRRTLSQLTVPAFRATCTLALSTAPRLAANLSDTFAQNIGADRATLLDRRQLSFPANIPQVGTTVASFAYTLPADRPYVFAGKGPLCVDLTVHSHTNRTGFWFDLYQEGRAHVATFGDACLGLDLTSTLTRAKVTHQATGLPADSPLFLLVGAPLRDPVDLTVLGAPGCWQSITLPVILPAFASSSGTYSVEFDATPARPGNFYAAQVMAVKPGINPLGAALTQANLILPIAARSAGRLWTEDLAATTGTPQPVFALVMEID